MKRNISSHLEVFFWKGALINFTKFTGKHLTGSEAFLIKSKGWGLQLYKKRNSDTCVFLWNLRNFKNTFVIENLRWLLLGDGRGSCSGVFIVDSEQVKVFKAKPIKSLVLPWVLYLHGFMDKTKKKTDASACNKTKDEFLQLLSSAILDMIF